jgi:TolB-like protein/DNA-binding winged helix-turn-helix (wHTH) protein
MANTTESRNLVRFGDFEVDLRTAELRSNGHHIILQEKPFQILTALLERPGEMISREELSKRLWPEGTFVDFNLGLNKAVNRLREALDDSAEQPRFIETFPKRGYRFMAPITRNGDRGPAHAVPTSTAGVSSNSESERDSDSDSDTNTNTNTNSVRLHGHGSDHADALLSNPPLAVLEKPAFTRRSAAVAGLLAIVILIVIAIFAGSYFAWRRYSKTPVPAGRIMMAVLPFQNLTGDPEQEYLTDGLTDETIARLGALQPERLGIVARTSVMGYKHGDKPLDQIGRELDVQYVLEGSVRRDRNRLRITAQLIQVKDQSHIWAQEYDRSSQDVIALQDDVAAGVTQEIQSRWAVELRNHPVRHQPATPQAYDAYLKGRYSLNRRTEAGLHNALGYFHAAADADPGYALAYVGLADCYILMVSNYDVSPEAPVLQARTAANKALALDPGLGEPHAVLALIAQNHDWNWEESEREFKLAMAADPADPTAHFWYSNGLAVRGRFDEGFREMAVARRLDPLSLPIRISEGAEFYMARRYDDALGECDRILEIEPNFAPAYLYRGLSYVQQGKWKEALADLETAKRLDDSLFSAAMLGEAYALAGDKTRARQILSEMQIRAKREHVSPLYPAIIHTGLGDKDLAFSELEAAIEQRATSVLGLKVAAIYDPLRSDPRFADLVRRVGLPPN